MARVGEAHGNLLSVVGDWFPDIVDNLDRFFADKAGVSVKTWRESKEKVIAWTLYGMGSEEDFILASYVICSGFPHFPRDRESSWKEGEETFVEFSITGKRLHSLYFENLRSIMGIRLNPDCAEQIEGGAA